MNTTANFQIFPTPYAFGPKSKRFRDLMLRDGKKIISQQFLDLDPLAKAKLNQNVLEIIFNVKINGIDLINLKLKKCIKDAFKLIDMGNDKIQSIKTSILQNIDGDYYN